MSFNFPNTPDPGDLFTSSSGIVWQFSEDVWRQTEPAHIDPPLSGATHFNSYLQAQMSTVPVDVQSIRLLGYYTAGDFGASSYRRATAEPTHPGKLQTADGAWWEIAEYIFTPQMFGAKAEMIPATGSSGADPAQFDDWPALQKALQMRGANSKKVQLSFDAAPYPYFVTGPTIYFPAGCYNLASIDQYGIQINARTHLIGDASGSGNSTQGSELVFPPNTQGIILNWADVVKDVLIIGSSRPGSAAGSSIRHLTITGGGPDGTNKEAHGINIRASSKLEHVLVRRFPGNGVNIVVVSAQAGTADPTTAKTRGNGNHFYFDQVRSIVNGLNGVFLDGPDANAGIGVAVDASSNGRWGIYDSSFLGNTWIGCHTAGNGHAGVAANGANKSAIVHYNDKRWYAYRLATESDLVATVPGTEGLPLGQENIWRYRSEGGPHAAYPTWQPGQPVGTYFEGGAYKSDNLNASNVFIGCYAEGDQVTSFYGPTFGVGGNIGMNMRVSNGNSVRVVGHNLKYEISGTRMMMLFGGNDPNGDILKWGTREEGAAPAWRLRAHPTNGDYYIDNGNTSGRLAAVITGSRTQQKMGTTEVLPYKMHFPQIGIGSGTNIRRQLTGTTPPTTLVHARGDVMWNVSPSIGGSAGWICTVGGWGAGTAAWASGTNYSLGSVVKNLAGVNVYRCTVDPVAAVKLSTVEPNHLSGLGAVLGDGYQWRHLIDPAVTPDWTSGNVYVANNDIRTVGERYYKCIYAGSGASTFVPTHTTVNQGVHLPDGYAWRLIGSTAADAPWTVGALYDINDNVRTVDGNSYKCVFNPAVLSDPIGTPVPASDKPTHTVGTESTDDGYSWAFLTTRSELPWVSDTEYALAVSIINVFGVRYTCTFSPGEGVPSINEPIHLVGTVEEDDGYSWTFIGTSGVLPWKINTNYALNADVVASNGHHYEVSIDPPATPPTLKLSTDQPTHATGPFTYPDGYGWSQIPTPGVVYNRWVTGNDYIKGARVLNNSGLSYECIIDPPTVAGASGIVSPVSTVEPVHVSGEVINPAPPTSDGYGWLHVGTVGNEWTRFGAVEGQQDISIDANFTLTPLTSPRETKVTVPLTANRTVTLSTTGAYLGLRWRITRTAASTGAFTLNVGTGPLKAMPTASWAEFVYDGAAWYLAASGSFEASLTATATYDPPSVVTTASTPVQTVTLTGAALGDIVAMSFSLDLQGLNLQGWVSSANTVSYRFSNLTGGPIDLASGTVKARIIK